MWPYLVFDLETLPDLAGFRRLQPLDAQGQPWPADDGALFQAWKTQREAENKSDFFPLHLQRVVCISLIYRDSHTLKVSSLVDRDGASEGRIVQQFFRIIDKHSPQIISWNGEGFDLPVLHYRGLIHGVQAQGYWDTGEQGHDGAFGKSERKWNNYLGRYHQRHLDLMDVLAKYQGKNNAPMDALAKLCGFAGKLGMDGSQVFSAWQNGQLESIRAYCETDVMNTWLLFCRFQKMRGLLHDSEYHAEMDLARTCMQAWAKDEADVVANPEDAMQHWQDYLQHWT